MTYEYILMDDHIEDELVEMSEGDMDGLDPDEMFEKMKNDFFENKKWLHREFRCVLENIADTRDWKACLYDRVDPTKEPLISIPLKDLECDQDDPEGMFEEVVRAFYDKEGTFRIVIHQRTTKKQKV